MSYTPKTGAPGNHQQTFDMDHVKQALDMLQKDLSPGDLPNFDMVKSAIDMIRAQETYQAQLNNPKKVTVPKIVMYPKSKAKPSAASSSLPEWENVLPISTPRSEMSVTQPSPSELLQLLSPEEIQTLLERKNTMANPNVEDLEQP